MINDETIILPRNEELHQNVNYTPPSIGFIIVVVVEHRHEVGAELVV